MKYSLIKIEEFSGKGASVYSILPDDKDETLLDDFFNIHYNDFYEEIEDIIDKIEYIGLEVGARSNLINEGKGGLFDGVFDIRDRPDIQLRLYGLKLRHTLIILGGGGQKNTKTIQDDPNLTYFQEILKDLSKQIDSRIADNEFGVSEDGYELIGNMDFEKK